MKPTDEAKRLRDEIAEIIKESDCGAPIERYYDDADESINKVLDVVCMEVNNVGLGAHNTLATKTAINKLRPKP